MEIVPGIHWIEGIRGNCYVISDETLTLIDTGMPQSERKILDYITRSLGRPPSDLNTIILTHCHVDHIGSASRLREMTGARIAAHPEDAEFITGRKPMPRPKGGIGVAFRVLAPVTKVRSFKVDTLLREGDIVSGMKVMHVPGHTPGSIALYDEKRRALFTGDTIAYRDGKVTGPPDQFTADPALARQSIDRMKVLDFDVILCGHAEPLTRNASALVRDAFRP